VWHTGEGAGTGTGWRSVIHLDWPGAVYNPRYPVNLLSVSDILTNKDGTPRDDNVLLKQRQLMLNESDPKKKKKAVPIVFMHGLYCVLFASHRRCSDSSACPVVMMLRILLSPWQLLLADGGSSNSTPAWR
jgi:hypothetical protein